jgi:hypothetical protein
MLAGKMVVEERIDPNTAAFKPHALVIRDELAGRPNAAVKAPIFLIVDELLMEGKIVFEEIFPVLRPHAWKVERRHSFRGSLLAECCRDARGCQRQ